MWYLAAEAWQVNRKMLRVENGRVRHVQTGRVADFAQLTKGQKLVRTIADTEPVTPVEKWQGAGTSVQKVNGRSFMMGF